MRRFTVVSAHLAVEENLMGIMMPRIPNPAPAINFQIFLYKSYIYSRRNKSGSCGTVASLLDSSG